MSKFNRAWHAGRTFNGLIRRGSALDTRDPNLIVSGPLYGCSSTPADVFVHAPGQRVPFQRKRVSLAAPDITGHGVSPDAYRWEY
jgi:hypothetical protein